MEKQFGTYSMHDVMYKLDYLQSLITHQNYLLLHLYNMQPKYYYGYSPTTHAPYTTSPYSNPLLNVSPYTNVNPWTQVNPHINPYIEVSPQTQVNPHVQVNPQTQINPKVNSNIEVSPKTNINFDPDFELNIGNK